MGRSRKPTLKTLRDAYALVGECRELGADPLAWRQHLAEGLCAIIPDTNVIVYELNVSRHTNRKFTSSFVGHGWTTGEARDLFLAYLACGDLAENPLLNHVISAREGLLVTRAFHLMPVEDWRCLSLWEFVDEADLDIDSVTTASTRGDRKQAITVHRYKDAGPLAERDASLISLLQREITSGLGGRLASFAVPSALELPFRSREVLMHLLRGWTVKQIAAGLDISRHTVIDYIKVIHKHFGVSRRGELIARLGGLSRSEYGEALVLNRERLDERGTDWRVLGASQNPAQI